VQPAEFLDGSMVRARFLLAKTLAALHARSLEPAPKDYGKSINYGAADDVRAGSIERCR
jgi:hypothetical protein